MKKAVTIVALVLFVGALVGIWFATRRSPGVATTPSQPSSPSAAARPVPELPAGDRTPTVESAAPKGRALPVEEPPRGRGLESRPDVVPRRAEEQAISPVPPQPRPEPPPDPARPAIRTEPEPPREPSAAPPALPAPAPAPAAPEPPRNLEPPPPNAEPSIATSPRPPATSSQRELVAVQRVLQRYEEMYDQLDANMAASIWPRMDSRALAKVFARLKRQNLNFDGCAVAVEEARATAHCTGWLTYVPQVGNDTPHREHHSWTIEFERTDGEWQILQVGAQ